VLIAAFGTASAAPPVTTRGSFSVGQVDGGLCGVQLNFQFDVTFIEHLFFNGDGQFVRVEFHASDTATATNPANGKSLSGHEVVNIHVDIANETEIRTGLPFHFNVPGGTVIIDAGRIFFDAITGEFVVRGKHQLLEGDLEAFCAALL
jgi:hypothetical protein